MGAKVNRIVLMNKLKQLKEEIPGDDDVQLQYINSVTSSRPFVGRLRSLGKLA